VVDPGFDIDPELEQQLREALRSRPAPQGFAERLMQRLSQTPSASPAPARKRLLSFPLAARLATAATVVLAVLVGGLIYQHQRQVAGQRARQQVLLALRITNLTLEQVGQKLNQDGKDAQP